MPHGCRGRFTAFEVQQDSACHLHALSAATARPVNCSDTGMTPDDSSAHPTIAADIMTSHPACCTPDTPIRRVAELMVLQDCGEIPVVENDDARVPIGVVTDRDIVCRLVARGKNPLEHAAAACMSQPAITVEETTLLLDVVTVMERHQIRRVPVVNSDGRCVGIVSQADLSWTLGKKDVGELVREVSRDSPDPAR